MNSDAAIGEVQNRLARGFGCILWQAGEVDYRINPLFDLPSLKRLGRNIVAVYRPNAGNENIKSELTSLIGNKNHEAKRPKSAYVILQCIYEYGKDLYSNASIAEKTNAEKAAITYWFMKLKRENIIENSSVPRSYKTKDFAALEELVFKTQDHEKSILECIETHAPMMMKDVSEITGVSYSHVRAIVDHYRTRGAIKYEGQSPVRLLGLNGSIESIIAESYKVREIKPKSIVEPSKKDMIIAAVKKLRGTFTVKDIACLVSASKRAIRDTLNDLVKDKIIKIVSICIRGAKVFAPINWHGELKPEHMHPGALIEDILKKSSKPLGVSEIMKLTGHDRIIVKNHINMMVNTYKSVRVARRKGRSAFYESIVSSPDQLKVAA